MRFWIMGSAELVKRGESVKYICTDRGSDACPCHLMEAGQCYTCTMVRDGICACEDAAGWQGVCPYTEYLQQGGKVLEPPTNCVSQFDVLSKTCFGPDLYVVKMAVPRGFAEACMRPGAYIMAEAMGWKTPLSVLRAAISSDGHGEAEFLLKAAGPKTKALTEDGCCVWNVTGPYFNGLLNGENLLHQIRKGFEVLVIARGTAAAPLIHLLHCPESAGSLKRRCRILLDDEALPERFREEYLKGWEYERVSLTDAEDLESVRKLLEEKLRKQSEETPEHEPVQVAAALLVSQYYGAKLTEGLTEKEKQQIAVPNPANMCCSMGLCGACSHTDQDGVTVRLCKCSRTVVE